MLKNQAQSLRFKILMGDMDIAGKCGDLFVVNESVAIEILGYTNRGSSYLVKSLHDGVVYQYAYKPKQ